MTGQKFLTNKDYVAKFYPEHIQDFFTASVLGCPCYYKLGLSKEVECDGTGSNKKLCEECWNMLAKINGEYVLKEGD